MQKNYFILLFLVKFSYQILPLLNPNCNPLETTNNVPISLYCYAVCRSSDCYSVNVDSINSLCNIYYANNPLAIYKSNFKINFIYSNYTFELSLNKYG